MSFTTLHLKMSRAKWRPFCLGYNEVLKIRSIWHTRDLWKLARSCKHVRLLCPLDPRDQVLPYSVDFKAPGELWNPLSKTVLSKSDFVWIKGPVNTWKAKKISCTSTCKYFPIFWHWLNVILIIFLPEYYLRLPCTHQYPQPGGCMGVPRLSVFLSYYSKIPPLRSLSVKIYPSYGCKKL